MKEGGQPHEQSCGLSPLPTHSGRSGFVSECLVCRIDLPVSETSRATAQRAKWMVGVLRGADHNTRLKPGTYR